MDETINRIIQRKVNEGVSGDEFKALSKYQARLAKYFKPEIDNLIKTLDEGRDLLSHLSAGKGGNLVRVPYNALEKDLKSAKENLKKLMSEIEGYI